MILKQSTARNLMVWMADSSDHISGKSGLTLTITASKDGAAFASISPTVTDLGSGWYNLALTTTHTNTPGCLALHITSTGADPTDALHEVCVDLPGGSVSSVTGSVGSVTGITSSDVGAIKAKTDNLPAAPADETLVINATTAIYNRIGAPAGASIAADLAEIEGETDSIATIISTLGTPAGASVSADIAAVLAAAATLGGIRKNVGVNGFPFRMFNNDGTPGLNLTVTGQVQLDGGTFTNLTNAVVEVGNGWYKVNLANADVNGKMIAFKFNGGTGVQETALTIVADT